MGDDAALVRMLRAGSDQGRDLDRAMDGLAQVFGRSRTAQRLGPHFTCDQANRVAWALVCSRHLDAAVCWLDGHAADDDAEDLHGHPGFDARRYLTGRGPARRSRRPS